jgi:hypothetical protein
MADTGRGQHSIIFLLNALESSAVYRKPNATKSAALLKIAA